MIELVRRQAWVASLLLPLTVFAQAGLGEADSLAPIEDVALDDLLSYKVVSASQQEEPVQEAPVPVTVITAEMIRASGARNLLEVLTTYVPGFTRAEDHNELQFAMRGVYASSQQKTLVLLDGHRLNSRAYSSANPDFSIGLDKLKRIEVLRGPGSSLYGNNGLTAVINLVTKAGRDVDGVSARAGAGNFGQLTGSVTAGKSFEEGKGDVLAWAHGFFATGEKVTIAPEQDYSAAQAGGTAILGGVDQPPSYDVGVRLRLRDWSFLFNSRMGKHTEPFTSGGGVTGEVFDASSIRTFRGIGPGLGLQSNHGEAKWQHRLTDALKVEATAYFDTNEVEGISTTSPTGGATYVEWNDFDVGGIVQARYDYDFGGVGKGNAIAGVQVEGMRVVDSILPVAVGGQWTRFGDTSATRLLEPGEEYSYSGFAQVKHSVGAFIFNAGLRFDYRRRRHGDPVSDLSPRLAAIWAPSSKFDLKLSYGQSFVDAPYWYRYNSLPSYAGSRDLRPEHLRSVQLTPTVSLLDGRFRNTLNIFYNNVYDFIYRNNLANRDINVGPLEPYYQNAGRLDTLGVEEEVAFVHDAFQVRGNATYQTVLASSNYPAAKGEAYNVPNFSGNLVLDGNPLFFLHTKKVWLNATAQFVGEQAAPINIAIKDATGAVVHPPYADPATPPEKSFYLPDHRVPACVRLNLGVHVTDVLVEGLSLDGTLYNLADARCSQGGSTVHPYPQTGRWFLVTLGYALKL